MVKAIYRNFSIKFMQIIEDTIIWMEDEIIMPNNVTAICNQF